MGLWSLTAESNRPAIATCSSRDLLFDTNLLDTGKVGCVTEEQVVDHDFARDVLNLATAEVEGACQPAGIGRVEVG